MILNAPYIEDWESTTRRKQQLTDKNINNENKTRKRYSYKTHKKVIVLNKKNNKYQEPYKGPHQKTKLWKIRTVSVRRGAMKERINVRWIKPHHE